MQRVPIDSAESSVKEFFRSLPLKSGGVELELDGTVICNVVPPGHQLSESGKEALLERGRELVRRSRERNVSAPEQVIEAEVALAVDEVRRRGES